MNDRFKLVSMSKDKKHATVMVRAEDLPRLTVTKEYRDVLLDFYIEHGFPKIIYHTGCKYYNSDCDKYDDCEKTRTEVSYRLRIKQEGNVVIGFESENILMLDCDVKLEKDLIAFGRDYTLHQDLGDFLLCKTSDITQVDLSGNSLANYAIIFGKFLSRDEIRFHVREAYRLGIVDRSFVRIRRFGSITIRVTAKNNEEPHPEIVYYFRNGDSHGIKEFTDFFDISKELG